MLENDINSTQFICVYAIIVGDTHSHLNGCGLEALKNTFYIGRPIGMPIYTCPQNAFWGLVTALPVYKCKSGVKCRLNTCWVYLF